MTEKHIQLVHYLCEHSQPVTAKALSGALGISVRSVSNYVNTLNAQADGRMIGSSAGGYGIDKRLAADFLDAISHIPQTRVQRAYYIIKQLLLAHIPALDLYELCDQLYIGLSTLKKDIYQMNRDFAEFGISFVVENDALRISGSEKCKRRLVSHVIYEETDNQFMNTDTIGEYFQDIPVEEVNRIIAQTLGRHQCYFNDFAGISLLMHLIIVIDRIKKGGESPVSSGPQNDDILIENDREYAVAADLYAELEQALSITFNKSERFEIYMLFKTNLNYLTAPSQDNLRHHVGEKVILFVREIAERVNDIYYLDLGSDCFLVPFTLHLKNLIIRCQNGTYTKNPLTQNIKTSYPTIYDIAIYISYELSQRFSIRMNEDEVAFLALHIGAEIGRQKTNEDKVKCVLFCPDYMQIGTQISNQLLLEFGSQIDIVKVAAKEMELENIRCDLCFTTVRLKNQQGGTVIMVPLFLQHSDKINIYNVITQIQSRQKFQILKEQFHLFFSDELFFVSREDKEMSRDDVIHLLSAKMLNLGFVDESFEEKVFARENAASTAFGGIAIPHTMKMEALKTCIGVYLSKEGIRWGQQVVYVVLLVAINTANKKVFHDLYEALVEVFSSDTMIQAVKNCSGLSDFQRIISCVYDC